MTNDERPLNDVMVSDDHTRHETVLVTGANGFVGQPLCEDLLRAGYVVRGAVRRAGAAVPDGVERVVVGQIDAHTTWQPFLTGVTSVVHLAARVHMIGDEETQAYFDVNRDGTRRLAQAAAQSGVKRLIFVSTIKVNGENTDDRPPFTPDDVPHPQDAYGQSKQQAEEALWQISEETGLEVVVIRPPLVYGPGVKGNFLTLIKVAQRGIPLPLGAVHNQRSIIYVRNLTDLIVHSLQAPQAVGETFLVSDGAPISTADMIRGLAVSFGKPIFMVPMAPSLLYTGANLLGLSAAARRIMGSLVVDDTYTRGVLRWSSPSTTQEGLQQTASWYQDGL